MTQINKRTPSTPKQASKASGPLDKALKIEIFKALADPTRLKLLACIAKCSRPCSVTEVADCCEIDFSVVSRHLALLARAEIIEGEKLGRIVSYRVKYKELSDAFDALSKAFKGCCTTNAKESCCGKEE